MRRPVLLYLLGDPPEAVAAAHGRFVDWFDALWRDQPVEVTPFRGDQPARPPDPRNFAGIVLSGSPASVTAPAHWMEIAVESIRAAASAGTPVLGVCFGHQLIGAAFGGSVIRNPRGWEMSTHAIELNAAGQADPLFAGIPRRFDANLSHADALDPATLSSANGVRVLACNDRTAVQAIAAGDAIRGVQFHPEFSGAIVRAYIRARHDDLSEDARSRDVPADRPAALAARARDAPIAARVLDNFVRHWVLEA